MKKTLIALAAVAASSAALAQSSVTLFGILDVNVRNVKTEVGGVSQSLTTMSQDGTASSRLGVRGVEDLGGGMSASFWLEGALNPDNGTAGGLSFQRRSTVSLSGGFGEVRLGRDYVPTFWNHTVYDPFGTNGLGSSINVYGGLAGLVTGTAVRSNNLISYFTPNMSGFQAQLSYGFKEVATGSSSSDYSGLRVTYAGGPLSVGFATASEGCLGTGAAPVGANCATADVSRTNVGASYDFGFIKPMFNYTTSKDKSIDTKITNLMIGLTAPVGPGLVKASYTRTELDIAGADADARQIALGYEYGLSKRTALYGNYARISTDPGVAVKTRGFEVGVRHAF
jgi:predicted porin